MHSASGLPPSCQRNIIPQERTIPPLPNPELLVVQLSGEITSLCRNNKA
ncbi:hypothetical protein Agau_C201462 [Agrobacterium tumefaciens F2]|nr:hypothetical protein Agau_C201462 [Agrobacterium tumefaciens F2]